MSIKKKPSISNVFFFYMLFIATLSCVIIGIVWISHEQKDFDQQTLEIKSQYLDSQKQELQNTIEHAVNYVHYKKALTQERLRQNIKQRVNEAHGIAWNIYRNNFQKRPDKEIMELIKQALGPVRFFDNRNYYFIDDLEGNSILFPPKPGFEGTNLMEITNKEGVRPFPEIIKLVKEHGEGYYVYNWVKYTEGNIPTDKEFAKITYFKKFSPYNWFIAVGEYLDYVQNDIKLEILERVSRIRLKNGEYVTIHTYDGKKLVSGGKILRTPVNEWDIVDGEGDKFVLKQRKAALADQEEFVYYDMPDGTKESLRSRVSFAKRLTGPEWIISAAAYIDEVDQIIAQEKSVLKKGERSNLVKIIFIIAGLWLFVFLIARYISHKTESSFNVFSHFFNTASTKSAVIDQTALHFSEFSELALSANQMIEKRQKAESMLKKSEEKHRKLVSNITDVIVIMDKDGIIRYKSPNIKKLFGWEPLELIGRHGLSTVHPDDRQRIGNQLTRLLKKEYKRVRVEYKYLCKDGSSRPIELTAVNMLNDPVIKGILANYKDVSEQKNAKEKLRQSEEKYRTMIERSNDMIWSIDKSGNITFFNEQTQNVTGLKLGDWMGKSFVSLIMEEDLPMVMEIFHKCLKGESHHYELRLKKPGGNILIISVNTTPTLKNGKVDGIVSFGRDITEQQKLASQFQRTQKMESIGTLAGGIAHDFNNILFPILGYSEMLLDDVPWDSPLQDKLEKIHAGALRAKNLVKQILTFSRQERSDLKLMKMQPIVKEALKFIRSTIPTTIDIKHDIQADCGVIKADPTQIHQIVMNLITNAYHAMENTGGQLNVSLKEMQLGQYDIVNPDMTPGDYACLTVADTGVGMDKDLTRKIFDPFFTTKEKGKGTGMGLSVVHGIVNSMGGAIKVYSEPGKGTEFNVYIAVEKNSSEEQKSEDGKSIQGGTEHILLVDDEEAIITMEKQMLERLGYKVTSRTSSVDALEAFHKTPDKFDLIITDMAMPNLPGDRLAVQLIETRPDIPILLCTGFSENMPRGKAASLGIKGFLMKPIVMKNLALKIREVLDKKKQ